MIAVPCTSSSLAWEWPITTLIIALKSTRLGFSLMLCKNCPKTVSHLRQKNSSSQLFYLFSTSSSTSRTNSGWTQRNVTIPIPPLLVVEEKAGITEVRMFHPELLQVVNHEAAFPDFMISSNLTAAGSRTVEGWHAYFVSRAELIMSKFTWSSLWAN